MHRDASRKISGALIEEPLHQAAQSCWDDAYEMGRLHGYRNGQVTVIAPTGTIGFMMDCDTTGVEPELALIKYKKLVGGGVIKIVNNTVEESLLKLGYSAAKASDIVSHIDSTGTIEGSEHIKEEHLPVFDCSFRPQNGERSIHYLGHLRMMGAVQPFISGAISKTINMPEESTVADVTEAYIEAWRLGLKSVAIYRDGSKRTQPLNTSGADGKQSAKKVSGPVTERIVYRPHRQKLPNERQSLTHKFAVGGHEGYITVGLYEDGTPGEIFIKMSKEGSTISGLMDSFATAVSMALQYGMPLKALVDKFAHVRFEPSGWTGSKDIPYAKSIMDYIFRWLGMRFISPDYQQTEAGETTKLRPTEPEPQQQLEFNAAPLDAPICAECGSLMTSNGSCYKCENCGSTSGCS
jgi:ribonucleoside-diphosphate reductase alpha chain